jgi:phage baseplate assembly protein W
MNERLRLLGSDLRVEQRAGGMDLGPDFRGDLALAHGADNIAQALALRLRTRVGELAPLGWPDFGSRLHELIGEPANDRTRLRASAFARAAVEADPRVAEVASVSARTPEGERDTVRLFLDVIVIDRPNPLNLVFDLSLGVR